MRALPGRLAIDFDGVVHAYSKGWCKGVIYDDPCPGTKEALHSLNKRYELVLFTARTNLDDVHRWLVTHHLRQYFVDITNTKPAALAYIDDRAIAFRTWTQVREELDSPKRDVLYAPIAREVFEALEDDWTEPHQIRMNLNARGEVEINLKLPTKEEPV